MIITKTPRPSGHFSIFGLIFLVLNCFSLRENGVANVKNAQFDRKALELCKNFIISNVLVQRYPNISDANEKDFATFETFSPLYQVTQLLES